MYWIIWFHFLRLLSSMASIFLIFFLSLLLFYPILCFSYEARNHEGKQKKGTHFVLFFSFCFSRINLFFLVFLFGCLVEALIAIRRSLEYPKGALSNWDEDSVDPCSWAMITCSSENLVIALYVLIFFFFWNFMVLYDNIGC